MAKLSPSKRFLSVQVGLTVLEYLNNYDIITDNTTSWTTTILKLNTRIEEYESLVKDLMYIISTKPIP